MSPYPHCGEFTISPFHHMNFLSFHHIAIKFVYHLTISPYKFVYNYTISLNKFHRHITQHLYQYYILKYNLSKYSEDSRVNRTTPKYVKAEKYDTFPHITTESLDNFPNLNSKIRNLVHMKPSLARTVSPQGGFVCMPSIVAIQ